MHRSLLPVLLALGIAAAAGRISHSNELAAADAARPERTPAALAALAASATGERGEGETEVTHELSVSAQPEGVSFALRLTNESSRRLELNFPDGYTHDITVLDAAGRPVWRWSNGRLFTQAMRNKMLAANESFEVSERWNPEGRSGTFTAVVELRSSNFPVTDRAGFTLP